MSFEPVANYVPGAPGGYRFTRSLEGLNILASGAEVTYNAGRQI